MSKAITWRIIREPENSVEHAFGPCNQDEINLSDFPMEIRHPQAADHRAPLPAPAKVPLARRKKPSKEELLSLLDDCDWNKAEAARRIGKSRTTVWKYMKEYEMPL